MKRIQIRIRIRIRITDFASCVEKKVDSDSNKRIRIQKMASCLSKCSLSAFGLSNVCTPGGPAATGTEVW